MDDDKLKKAFGKVKRDIFTIASDVEKLRNSLKELSKNSNVSKSGKGLEILSEKMSAQRRKQDDDMSRLSEQSRINHDMISSLKRQLENLESEMKKMIPYTKADVKELEKSVKSSGKQIEKFDKKLSKSEEKIKFDSEDLKLLKKDNEKSRKELESHEEKINFLNDKVDDFTGLVQEKVLLEMESTKQELLKEIEKNKKSENGDLNDFSELIQEKLNLEISSLRLEFTDEIAKIYDKFFSEVIELKGDLAKKDNTKSSKSSSIKKVYTSEPSKEKAKQKQEEMEAEPQVIDSNEDEHREGIVKRFTRWLFIDYEEDDEDYEIDDIKSEVKEEKMGPVKDTKIKSAEKKTSSSKNMSKK